jgi:hypothetical protein
MSGGPLRLARILVAVLVLAVVGVSIAMVVARRHHSAVGAPGPSPSGTASSPGPSASPPRVAFAFPAPEIIGLAVSGAGGRGLAVEPAQLIQTTLSQYYDQAFMDPATWTEGVPAATWSAFDASIRGQAKKDASSLALGATIPDLASLRVTKATLTVQVLLDAKDQPEAAEADVVFLATGADSKAGQVTVTNRATFLFRLVGGEWLIFAYPKTTTTVTTTPASPSATPTAAPTPSAGTSP